MSTTPSTVPATAARFPGQTALRALLAGLSPKLWEIPRIIRVQPCDAPLPPNAIAVVREAEGCTVIESIADHTPSEGEPQWAQITLSIDSSLEAVGLTAAVAQALAEAGIPCNVVAAMHHDHLFVPWAQRDAALAALHTLSEKSR
ncbi:MAG: ACT domain-containing protein [Silanimonas sp.]